MKRLFTPLYWTVAVIAVALMLWSVLGSLGRSLFLSVMLLPGVLFFKFFVRDISYRDRRKGILDTIWFACAVMVIEYLGVFFVYINVDYPFDQRPPAILTNPLFLWLILGALLSLEWVLRGVLAPGPPVRERFITFTSERRRTTIEIDEIVYIESLDDEVAVVVRGGARYPTRMKISGWEAALDDRFVRVHRSFIVGRGHITRIEGHTIWLGDFPIEVSRKYREKVLPL